jgi:hypothetical protein
MRIGRLTAFNAVKLIDKYRRSLKGLNLNNQGYNPWTK